MILWTLGDNENANRHEREREKAAKKEITVSMLLTLHDLLNNNKRHSFCAAPGQMSMTQSAEDARRKKQRQIFTCCFLLLQNFTAVVDLQLSK